MTNQGSTSAARQEAADPLCLCGHSATEHRNAWASFCNRCTCRAFQWVAASELGSIPFAVECHECAYTFEHWHRGYARDARDEHEARYPRHRATIYTRFSPVVEPTP